MHEISQPATTTLAVPRNRAALWSIVLTMAVITALTALTANSYWLTTLTSAFALALAARGVGLLYAQLGLVSLAQMALVGVGGWVALRLSHGTALPFEAVVLLAGVVTSIIGMIWGAPALRLQGLYLALVTLMLAGAFQIVIVATGFPDGGPGLLGRADATQRLMMQRPALAQGGTAYFIYVALWLTAGLVLVEYLRLGRSGRAWALIRRGRAAAQSTGVNMFRAKMKAFALTGFLAGVAGALLAGNVGQLDGRSFSAPESLFLFALSLVGGAHHWLGALLAGLLLRAVPSLLTDFGVSGYAATVIFGAALMHALITAPQGIAGQVLALAARLRKPGKE
ncbi:MAG: branched-chain amino acid ABC transporter permease [Pseudomonadota bacterium]